MNRSGHWLKLFGLSVLALGLMAFSATAAQAEGTWMVAGKTLAANKTLTGNLVGSDGALLTTLGLNKVTFLCTAAALEKAELEWLEQETRPPGLKEGGTISAASKNAKIKFSGCITIIGTKEATACEPESGGVKKVIATEEGYALIKLHKLSETEKDSVTDIVPKVGETFAVIHMSKTCAIGESVEVFGELVVKDSENALETEKAIHTIQEFTPLTKLTVANKESKATATLDGKAEVKLESGEAWSGLP